MGCCKSKDVRKRADINAPTSGAGLHDVRLEVPVSSDRGADPFEGGQHAHRHHRHHHGHHAAAAVSRDVHHAAPAPPEDDLKLPREQRKEFAEMLAKAGPFPQQEDERGGPLRSPLRSQLMDGLSLGRDAELPLVRRTVRTFFSSTFSDMEQERNVLIADVYPYLRLLARRYGLDFQAVDMRWGVSDESVDDHNVVQICSEEVARCVGESAGPAFMLLGGQKYGYRPLPPVIPVPEFEGVHNYLRSMVNHTIDPSALELLSRWYQLDENAVPPAYRLAPISSHYPGYVSHDRTEKKMAEDAWQRDCERLTAALRAAATSIPDPERRRLYTVSVTEMEILGALDALRASKGLDSFYVVDRQIDDLELCATRGGPHGGAIRRFIDCVAAPTPPGHGAQGGSPAPPPEPAGGPLALDGEAQRLLRALRERVEAAVLPGHAARAATRWAQPLPAPYVRSFSDAVCRALAGGIAAAARRAAAGAAHDPVVAEVLQHTRTARQCARQCHGRLDLRDRVVDYLESAAGGGEGAAPLALVGASGTGKSSLMGAIWAEACRRAERRGARPVIAGRFCGTTLHSADARSLMQSVIEQLADAYECESSEMIYSNNIRDVAACFAPALGWGTRERPLYILLDALDQLSDAGNGRKLAWLPSRLPPHTRLVVSILPGAEGGGALESFQDFVGGSDSASILRVPEFDRRLAEEALDSWHAEARRTLTAEQRAEVMRAFAGCPTPLCLRMCWQEASRWRSTSRPPQAAIPAADVPGLVECELHRLEQKYGPGVVSGALGYITLARKGITAAELEDVLSCDDAVLDGLFVWWTPPVRRVPPSLLLRIRSDLGAFLAERGAGDTSAAPVLGWYHRQFAEAARRRYLHHPDRVREMHEVLAAYFGDRYAAGKAVRAGTPGAKPRSLTGMGSLVSRHVAAQPLMLGPGVANVRRLHMQPAHLEGAGQYEELFHACVDPRFVDAAAAGGCLGALLSAVESALAAVSSASASHASAALADGFFDLKSFLGRNFRDFASVPGPTYVLQQAANERDDSLVSHAAVAHLAETRLPWIRELNKRLSRDPCVFAVKLRYGSANDIAYGSVDVWRDTHVVVASHEGSCVACYDGVGNDRWVTKLENAPYGPLRVSNDGSRMAVAVLPFPSVAVLSMAQGKLLGLMQDPNAEDPALRMHRRSGYSDRIELICWSADSKRLATAAHGDMESSRDVVLWDAVSYRPLKVACKVRAGGGEMWSIHPHSRFGSHGRTSFGFGTVDGTKESGALASVFYDVSADRTVTDALDREYEGQAFDLLLAESHCGRFRVLGKMFLDGGQRSACLLFVASNDDGRVLAYLGTLDECSPHAAVEPAISKTGGEVVRVVTLRADCWAVPEVYEVDPRRPGPALALGERPDPGTPASKLGEGAAGEAAWRFAVEHGRHRPRLLGVLAGHAGDVWAARFAPGGQRLVSYDREELRAWDLAFMDLELTAREAGAGDAVGQAAPCSLEALAVAPLVCAPAAAPAPGLGLSRAAGGSNRGATRLDPLVACLRSTGDLSLVRAAPGACQAKVVRVLPEGARQWAAAAVAIASKGVAAHVLIASATGRLAALQAATLPDGGLEVAAPSFLDLRLPSAATALALSPGAGPLAAVPDSVEAYVGCADGGVHALVLLLTGARPSLAARRASWFHGGPVASLAASPADPRAAGRCTHTHVASLAYDGTLALAALPAAPAVACRVAFVDRRPLQAGSDATAVAIGESPSSAPPPVAVAAGYEVLLYVRGPRGFERRRLRGHPDRVAGIAFIGARLASVGQDNRVRLWDGATGRALFQLGLWQKEGWSAVALDGVSGAGAVGASAGGTSTRLACFGILNADSAKGEPGAEEPPAEPCGGEAAADARLPLRALAQAFQERYTLAVGTPFKESKELCWMEFCRDLRELPPGRYGAAFQAEIGHDTDHAEVHFRVRGPAVLQTPRQPDWEQRANLADYRNPADFNRYWTAAEQEALRGQGYTDVPLTPFHVARRSEAHVSMCHSNGDSKSNYGVGAVKVRPLVAGLPDAEPPPPPPAKPDAPAASLDWPLLKVVEAAPGADVAVARVFGG